MVVKNSKDEEMLSNYLNKLPQNLKDYFNSSDIVKKVGKKHRLRERRGTAYHNMIRRDILMIACRALDLTFDPDLEI